MMTLTVYSNNYDDYSYVVGRGMSGKVFLENGKSGKQFRSVEAALDALAKSNAKLDQIIYNFQVNGQQYFKRLKIDNSADVPKAPEVLAKAD